MNDPLLKSKMSCPHNIFKEKAMSRFRKLSQTIWHCRAQWRVRSIRVFSEQQGDEIVELNIQVDHIRLFVMIPPEVRILARQLNT